MTVFHKAAIGINGGSGDERVDAEVSREFLDRIPGGILRYRADDEAQIDYINSGLYQMFGCGGYEQFCELTGNTFWGMVYEEDRDMVAEQLESQLISSDHDHIRFRIQRKDGEIRWVEDNGHRVVDSAGDAWFYVTLLDVTNEVRLQEELDLANERFQALSMLDDYQRKADHDGLTGLLNRAAGTRRIKDLLDASERPCSFIVVDVDDFKRVNDEYGHPMGDRVLVALARHLKNTVRANDVVARFGGDEFVLFCMGLGPIPALENLVGRLAENSFASEREDDTGFGFPSPTVSIGVASALDAQAVTMEELYAEADKALYEAKGMGKNQACFHLLEPSDDPELQAMEA